MTYYDVVNLIQRGYSAAFHDPIHSHGIAQSNMLPVEVAL